MVVVSVWASVSCHFLFCFAQTWPLPPLKPLSLHRKIVKLNLQMNTARSPHYVSWDQTSREEMFTLKAGEQVATCIIINHAPCRASKNNQDDVKNFRNPRANLLQQYEERLNSMNQYSKTPDTNYPRSRERPFSPNRWEPISHLTPRKHLGSRVEPRCKWSRGKGGSGPANVLGEEKLMKETERRCSFVKMERE